jgi:hypothetical protein
MFRLIATAVFAMSLPLAAYANGVLQSVNGELRAGPAGQPGSVVAVDQRLDPGTSEVTGTDAQAILGFDDGLPDFMAVLVNPAYLSVLEGAVTATTAAGTVAFGAGGLGSSASSATLATAIAAAASPAAAAPAFSNLSAAAPVGAGGAATGAGTAAGAAATPSATAAVPAAAAAAAIAEAAATNHDSTSTTTHH